MGSYYLRGRIQEKSLKKSKWYTKPILDHKLEGLGKYWQLINICHSEFFERKKSIKKTKNNVVFDPKFLYRIDEVKYPFYVNNTLTILVLGEINYKNKLFHSRSNIFPVGFMSIRIH